MLPGASLNHVSLYWIYLLKFSFLIISSLHPFQQPLKKQKQTEDDMDSDIESNFSQSVLTNYKQKAFTLTQTQEIHGNVCERQLKKTINEVIFELSFVVQTWVIDAFIWWFSNSKNFQ